MGSVKIKLHPNKVRLVVGGQSQDSVQKAAKMAQTRARANIRQAGRIDTGELIQNIIISPSASSGSMRYLYDVTATAKHAIFNELGTKGATARPGGVLVFKPKGSSTFVFAKKTRGIRGIHFMRGAIQACRIEDFTN